MKNILIKNLQTTTELNELISVFSQAFESEYSTSETYLQTILQNKAAICLGAFSEQKIVGGVIAFEMTPIHGTKELYLYDIAVHPDYQKRGIGAKLIEHVKAEAKTRDIGTIFVEAESEDEGAVTFYRKIGGEELTVNHFNFYL